VTSPALAGAILGLVAGAGLLLVLAATTGGAVEPRNRRPGYLRRLLLAAGMPQVPPMAVVATCVGAGLVIGVLALLVTAVPMAALLAAVGAANAPLMVIRRRGRQRTLALRRSWPEAVDTLVSAIRAGMSLPEAVIELSRCGPQPLREACAQFAAEYRASGSFATALDALQRHLADPVADRVVASLRIARDVGGSDLGVVLRTLSSLLREDARTRGEIEARQSWTVSAARLAVAAPWITLALLCTRAEAIEAYASAGGAFVLLVAAALSVVAYQLMLRIGRLPAEARLAA
jgi:tight adherence protein B